MEEELVELCKDVYERTGWKDTESRKGYVNPNDPEGASIPRYTSDYLLEKFFVLNIILGSSMSAGWWVREQSHGIGVGDCGSPLEALLEFTIALDESGKLKAGELTK